jgi:hypothetical protein
MLAALPAGAQNVSLKQYFDGADTTTTSLAVQIDPAPGNVWQIGSPGKFVFTAAATAPNAIVTDTAGLFSYNNTSRFSFRFKDSVFGAGNVVIAIRWKQKLSMDRGHSGGIVEFSKNGGPWQNAFSNPNVYNFYGFLQTNRDTLSNGQAAFTGTDNVWRDVWFCLRAPYASISDSFDIRYTLSTDSSGEKLDGWIIDNIMVQRTFQHTVEKIEGGHVSRVYPTNTTGIVHIDAAHTADRHVIQSVRIMDNSGRILQSYAGEEKRYMIDISMLPAGRYNVLVTTNKGTETLPVVLSP